MSHPSMLSRISSYSCPFSAHSSGVNPQKGGRAKRYSRTICSISLRAALISLRFIKITSLQSSGFPLDFTIKDRLPQFRTVSVRKIKKGHNLWSCPFYGGSLHIFKFPNLDKHYNLDISNFDSPS